MMPVILLELLIQTFVDQDHFLQIANCSNSAWAFDTDICWSRSLFSSCYQVRLARDMILCIIWIIFICINIHIRFILRFRNIWLRRLRSRKTFTMKNGLKENRDMWCNCDSWLGSQLYRLSKSNKSSYMIKGSRCFRQTMCTANGITFLSPRSHLPSDSVNVEQ